MNAYNYNIQNQCLQYGKKKLLVSSLNFMKNLDISRDKHSLYFNQPYIYYNLIVYKADNSIGLFNTERDCCTYF